MFKFMATLLFLIVATVSFSWAANAQETNTVDSYYCHNASRGGIVIPLSGCWVWSEEYNVTFWSEGSGKTKVYYVGINNGIVEATNYSSHSPISVALVDQNLIITAEASDDRFEVVELTITDEKYLEQVGLSVWTEGVERAEMGQINPHYSLLTCPKALLEGQIGCVWDQQTSIEYYEKFDDLDPFLLRLGSGDLVYESQIAPYVSGNTIVVRARFMGIFFYEFGFEEDELVELAHAFYKGGELEYYANYIPTLIAGG